MFEPDQDGVYARVPVAPSRRFLAMAILYGLGAFLLYLAFGSLSGLGGSVLIILLSAGCLWAGEKMRSAAGIEILLTADQIVTSDGFVLAMLDEVIGVNRGALAAKPSTGFTLVLNKRHPRTWRPGVWWRIGRHLGIGGITGSGAGKFMAEQIAFRIAERDGSA